MSSRFNSTSNGFQILRIVKLIFPISFIILFSFMGCKKKSFKQLYTEGKHQEIIKRSNIENQSEEDSFFSALSFSQINLSESKDDKKVLEKFKIKNNNNPFSAKLEKLKSKFELENFILESKTNSHEKNAFKLKEFLEKDPRIEIEITEKIVRLCLKTGSITHLAETDKEYIFRLIEFYSTRRDSIFHEKFFRVKGKNVNIRTGPGIENSIAKKISEEEIIALDEDLNFSQIGDKKGKWIQIYSKQTETVGWIFSSFLEAIATKPKSISEFDARLKYKFDSIKIDFEEWSGEEIPKPFYGNYSKISPVVENGIFAFPISENPNSEICMSLKNIKKSFRIKSKIENLISPTLFLKLKLNGGDSIIIKRKSNQFLINETSFPILDNEFFQLDFFPSRIEFKNLPIYEKEVQLEKTELCLPVSKEKKERILIYEILLK